MALFQWQNGQAGGTPLSAENLMEMQRMLIDTIFPIGSTYTTQDNTNPNSILGVGTWERFKGKVALGLDEDDANMSVIGRTGGEKEHTLTINEMPKHNHTFLDNNSNTYPTIATMVAGGNYDASQLGGSRKYENIYVNYNGNSEAHNNMPPYKIVGYMWIRTA